jgi:hypothetical protein
VQLKKNRIVCDAVKEIRAVLTKFLTTMIGATALVVAGAASAAPIINGTYELENSQTSSNGIADGVYLNGFIKQSNVYDSRRWSVSDGGIQVTSAGVRIRALVENLRAVGADLRFQLDATFSVSPLSDPNNPTTPTCQVQAHCDVLNNADFIYYVVDNLSFGTLTGLGDLQDITLDLFTRPIDGSKPPQLGVSGSGHTASLEEPGFATWLYWTAQGTDTPASQRPYTFGNAGTGDINLVLGDQDITASSIPLPASVWLFMGAFAGLALCARRSRV